MPIRTEIHGTRELRKSLDDAGADMADMRALHAQVGKTLASAGKPLAPSETGRLAATIRGSGTKTAGVVRAGSKLVPYAGVQEFGWPAMNIPAHPYLTRALEEHEDEFTDMYLAELDRILGRVHGVTGPVAL